MSKESIALQKDILAFLKIYNRELSFDPGSRLLSSPTEIARAAEVSALIQRLESVIGKKETYYVLIEPWSVYAKTEKLFEGQNGLTEEWGKRWVKTEAHSVEEAIDWGYDEQRRRELP